MLTFVQSIFRKHYNITLEGEQVLFLTLQLRQRQATLSNYPKVKSFRLLSSSEIHSTSRIIEKWQVFFLFFFIQLQ